MLAICRPNGDDRTSDKKGGGIAAGTAAETLDNRVPDQPHVQQSAADAAGRAQLLDNGLLAGL